ncbi:LysR substrate-binding domain-containing protein [Caulobacter rhizosphaerae]|jgi:DNA-binding transcriptional LysR family regulator|uniref:LysR substrate-binding domain-containing protein n=1 Tax=Caulobacter rhizosphaerae TaxID=2010972 RepID=UPI0013D44C49|nr:LysR substrate-binding domain-containing protein [Caulobacter rhizosphaerae]GGL44445.1 LysR family transcriptional regulator [Caulobacter rhizosphaerae]
MAARLLPPLNALRAFEAFGRRGRMTLAADELCVTHGAISRQIRQLEDHLGVALTEGPRNRLALTETGLILAQALTQALDQIEAALPQPAGDGTLVVSCLPTFAIKWLIPRLPGFVAAHPEIPVRIVESNGPFDFRADGVDLAIRMRLPGAPPSPDADVAPFLKHAVGPVASPGLAAQVHDLESLAGLPRLHTRTFLESWAEWEAAAGLVLPPAAVNREFDHYFYMLEAAAAGLGVALSPFAFVENDLAAGRLVAPLGLIPGQAEVCALTPRGRASRAARRFRDWLVAQGAATPAPPGSQQMVEPGAAKPLTLSRPAL